MSIAALTLLGLASACGNDAPRRRPPPAAPPTASRGTAPQVVYVGGSGSSGPAFGGPVGPRTDMPPGTNAGGMIGRVSRETQARLERDAYRGPQRIGGPDENAVRLAQAFVDQLPPAEDGPDGACRDALHAREVGGRAGDAEEQARFLTRCRALPEAQQRCMSPHYQRDHVDECVEQSEAMVREASRRTGVDLEHPGRRPSRP